MTEVYLRLMYLCIPAISKYIFLLFLCLLRQCMKWEHEKTAVKDAESILFRALGCINISLFMSFFVSELQD